jgi:hypothetical protein
MPKSKRDRKLTFSMGLSTHDLITQLLACLLRRPKSLILVADRRPQRLGLYLIICPSHDKILDLTNSNSSTSRSMAPGLAPMMTAPRWLPRHRQLGVIGQVAWGLAPKPTTPSCVTLAPAWIAQALSRFSEISPPEVYLKESFKKKGLKDKKKKDGRVQVQVGIGLCSPCLSLS